MPRKPRTVRGKSGRPPSDAQEDALIGRTCAQLLHYGFTGRSEVYPAVGVASAKVLGRRLTAHRVEQLYERWVDANRLRWPARSDQWVSMPQGWYVLPSAHSKARLRENRPDVDEALDVLAERLLRAYREFGDPDGEQGRAEVRLVMEGTHRAVAGGTPKDSLRSFDGVHARLEIAKVDPASYGRWVVAPLATLHAHDEKRTASGAAPLPDTALSTL